jgi:hypothetical protein
MLSTDRLALIGHLCLSHLHAQGFLELHQAIFGLESSEDLYLMQQWVDDVFHKS